MATSPNKADLAEMVAKRSNPSGKSSAQMTREMMEKKAAKPAAPAPTTPEPPISSFNTPPNAMPSEMKKGGAVKKMAKGGSVSSRADGCAQRGKTKGRVI